MAELKGTEAGLTTAGMAARTTSPATGSQVHTGMAGNDRDDSDGRMPLRNDTTSRRDWDSTPAMTADQQVSDAGPASSLFSNSDIGDLRSRWSNVQAKFVDEPRLAVEDADQLVATVMQRLAEGFAKERDSLEKQWDSGETASTEDLRMALQHYRAFFNRLLNAA